LPNALMPSRCHLLLPAAGSGRRMAAERPKQYLSVAGKTLLQHTLERLALLPLAERITLVLAAGDPWWPEVAAGLPLALRRRLQCVDGGAERAASVLQGLEALQPGVQAEDFVLVHDAVRPCVALEDIRRLMVSLEHEPAGGLLASPLRDTLKRVDAAGYVVSTADRRGLWSAAAPQMFRYGVLLEAVRAAQRAGVMVTDEAQAVEQLGHRVLVVAGRADNIKVTFPEDLPLVERLLQGGADATADR